MVMITLFLYIIGNILCSPIPKLLTHSSNSVTKLTDQKIRWIIRAKMKEILSTNDIALLQNVSGSRIRQIWRQYRNTMTVPILANPGRPSRSITKEEISAVVGIYKEYPCSAVVLETILENRHGIKIPHNRIHKILKNHRLASNDTNKQRRRKWIKYERRHSMSLWHTDWYLIEDDRWQLITIHGSYSHLFQHRSLRTQIHLEKEKSSSIYHHV